jgi:hypothetical protein
MPTCDSSLEQLIAVGMPGEFQQISKLKIHDSFKALLHQSVFRKKKLMTRLLFTTFRALIK